MGAVGPLLKSCQISVVVVFSNFVVLYGHHAAPFPNPQLEFLPVSPLVGALWADVDGFVAPPFSVGP